MPQQTFEVTAPDGRTVEITGDRMPNGAELQAIFAKLPPAKPNPIERMGPGYRDPMAGLPREADWGAVGRNVKAQAPVLGAMAATALVPPAAAYTIPAALAGGFAGAMARGDEPVDALKTGAAQGALEAGGLTMGKVLRAFGSRLYRGMLKPSKAVREEFPNVSDELLEARRLITRGGADKAADAVSAASAKADAMTEAAAQAGGPNMSVLEVAQPMKDVIDVVDKQIRAGVKPASEMAKITERINRMFQQAGGAGYNLGESTELKRTAQKAAIGAYNQLKTRTIKELSTEDLLDAAAARGFKEAIEARVPGIKDANALTQKLIGQSHALEDAVGRTGNHIPFGSVSDLAAMTAGTLGNPALGAAVKASTFAPTASALAITANELGKRNAATAVRIGQLVWINGKQQRVLAVSHDGTFEAVPAPGAKR